MPYTNTSNHQPTIILLAALKSEVSCLLKKLNIPLKRTYADGKVGDIRLITKVTGMGGKRAIDGLAPLLEEKPSLVISAGFGGGLVPALKLGDLVHISTIVNPKNDSLSLKLPIKTTGTIGKLITVEQIADSPEAKKQLYQTSGAQVVDMESFYVAKLCQQNQIPITALRVISDTVDSMLPEYIANWIKPDGSNNYLKIARDLILHPSRISTTKQIGRDFNTAGEKLAKAIIHCLELEQKHPTAQNL